MSGINSDQIEDYEGTVHSWVMSNGGSNENGRISKSFFNGKSHIETDDRLPFEIIDGDFEDHSWLREKKLKIIAGCELSYFSELMKRSGLNVEHSFENHGGMDPYTELINPNPSVNVDDSDFIILSQVQVIRPLISYWEKNRGKTSSEEQKNQLKKTIDALDWSIAKIRKSTNSPIWLLSHVTANYPSYGISEYRGCGDELSTYEIAMWYKLYLYDLCKRHDMSYVFDVDLAFENTGKWPQGSAPLIRPFESLGGHPEKVGARTLASYFYRYLCINSKHEPKIKCVILDCDNTLWDGVIREDGPDGVKINRNRLKRLMHLCQRGLVLALCSKNDPEDLDAIMQVLSSANKEFSNSLVSHRINWQPKSANIKSIVEELNIGFDTIAFFDDNPFEREEVKSILSEVSVYDATDIELAPNWPTFQPYGDLNTESGQRFQLYKDEAKRKTVEVEFREEDFESFLHSCGLRIEIRNSHLEELPRVAELIQRTNQMNATLTRIDLPEIRRLYESIEHDIIICKLGDKFGDYGIIGTLICSSSGSEMNINELALSCRAMGRKVEHALLEEIIGLCKERELGAVRINVQKTHRNHQIISILEEKGFQCIESEGDLHAYELVTTDLTGRDFPPWFEMAEIEGDASD